MRVIFRLLVGVLNDKAYGCTSASAFKDAGEEFHRVGFLPLGHNCRLAGPSFVQFLLDGLLIDLQACRTSVDDASYGIAVGFPESSKLKKFPEGISGHLELFLTNIIF